MMNYIVTFRSRTNAIKFYDSLRHEGIKASLINTPKSAGIGCGLSVRTDNFKTASNIISGGGYSSFYAIFEVAPEGLIKVW